MKIRSVVALSGLAISLALPTFAQQQKSLKELIVGTWLLDSVYDQTQDGEKHNPWGDGVKGQAMFDAQGHYSWMIMSANRAKADTSPRIPVGQAIAYWGTYTIDEAAKTFTGHIERSTFPQWDGGGGTPVSIAFPTEDEFEFTVTKPFPDPTLGPIAPHPIFKRAPASPSSQ
jgi:hypothetical protein